MQLAISIIIFLIVLLLTMPEEVFQRKGMFRVLLQSNQNFGHKIKYQNKSVEMLMKLSRSLTKSIPIKISDRYREKISKTIMIADYANILTVTDFVRIKYTISFLCTAYFLLFSILNPSSMSLLLVIAAGGMGYFIPDNWISGKAKKRQRILERELPSILSTMAITTDAGLNLLQAVEEVSTRSNNQLSQEFRKALEDTQIGISQKQAFEKMAERCGVDEINHFVSALIQALEKGSGGLTQLLRELAKESWDRRIEKARDLAEKASIKLFMPLLLLVFPAFVIFLIGPMIFSIVDMLFKP